MTRIRLSTFMFLMLLFCTLTSITYAGPPFMTDDPEPVPYRHWELYTFFTRDQTINSNSVQGPALELNNGIAPDTQIHMILPESFYSQYGVTAAGLGDIELGVKYRFLHETKNHAEAGIFPLAELPTGDASAGLGNGRTWFKMPVWLQKSRGNWTTYGGGGFAYNHAPGQRDYFYGGLLIQNSLNSRLTLGGEIFLQGAQALSSSSGDSQTPGARSSAIWNMGGYYNFTPDFSLLFTAGHSFQGDRNSIMYVGLYRTWGPGSP